MMDMITDDLKYVGQIVYALRYNKRQSDIGYAKRSNVKQYNKQST